MLVSTDQYSLAASVCFHREPRNNQTVDDLQKAYVPWVPRNRSWHSCKHPPSWWRCRVGVGVGVSHFDVKRVESQELAKNPCPWPQRNIRNPRPYVQSSFCERQRYYHVVVGRSCQWERWAALRSRCKISSLWRFRIRFAMSHMINLATSFVKGGLWLLFCCIFSSMNLRRSPQRFNISIANLPSSNKSMPHMIQTLSFP